MDAAISGTDPAVLALLALAALVAGWVDAVVGGGGLIQLPALLILLPGASPAQVLATNKVAGICGTGTAAVTYARRVRPAPRTVLPTAVCAMAGAATGAACAGLLPEQVFRPLVLVLVVMVAVYVVRRPDLGQVTSMRLPPRKRLLASIGLGASIGFYDGIFGPGTGSFLVLGFVAVVGYSFVEASARARIVNAATNLGALLVFIPQGAPLWLPGLVMGACAVVGGYVGARTALARGNRFVRAVFLVVVTALALRLGWDVLRGG